MRPISASLLVGAVGQPLVQAATVYLCGDSTMAASGGGSGTEGWGQFLQYSLNADDFVVVNKAIGGRSARSYTREGRFDEVIDLVQEGDFVVIEFGHNDGGSLSTDNGRTDCFGAGEETCETTYDGVAETVHTFPWYFKQASSQIIAKGASVVLSSATPNNVWESGSFSWGYDRFFYYTWLAADELGGPPGAYFVPHGEYAAQAMYNLGADTVNEGYPVDHTHTGPYLADVMSQAFVLGLACGTSSLGASVLNSTEDMSSTFLGGCLDEYNSTVTALLR